jgi:hypothetical protein
MAHRLVEGHPGDRQINPGQVLGIGPAQETRRPTKGVLIGIAAQTLAGDRGIDFVLGIFQGHLGLLQD